MVMICRCAVSNINSSAGWVEEEQFFHSGESSVSNTYSLARLMQETSAHKIGGQSTAKSIAQ
jgi:hypothetical protein